MLKTIPDNMALAVEKESYLQRRAAARHEEEMMLAIHTHHPHEAEDAFKRMVQAMHMDAYMQGAAVLPGPRRWK